MHKWAVCTGVPNGTSLWPVGDSAEQNECYKMYCSEYENKLIIGWDHVLLGRLSSSWESLAVSGADSANNPNSKTWTKQIIRLGWTYGMDLWKARNAMVHDTEGPISVFEIQRTQQLVKVMYADLLPGV